MNTEEEKQVSWHRATLKTWSGDKLPVWVLKQGERTILTAVSPSECMEAVSPEDRQLIGELLASVT